jgi:hypothetical protein
MPKVKSNISMRSSDGSSANKKSEFERESEDSVSGRLRNTLAEDFGRLFSLEEHFQAATSNFRTITNKIRDNSTAAP